MQDYQILVVEDTPLNQTIVRQQLKNLGYHQVTFVSNGLQALEKLATTEYDLVLMDCFMPLLDGYQTTQMLRQQESQGKHTIVIAMTANDLPEDKEKCLAAGMDDYLCKPLEHQALDSMLKHWLIKPTNNSLFSAKDTFNRSPVKIITEAELPINNSSVTIEQIPIDLERLQIISRGNKTLQQQFLQNFLVNAWIYLEVAQKALQKQDLETLQHQIHQLKGSSKMVGIHHLPDLAATLENHIQNHQLIEIPELLTKIEFILTTISDFSKEQ